MNQRIVGILGGMGPEATILLQRRVMATVQARDDADHLPLLIDMNPQVPSRIAHLLDKTGPNPGPTLAHMAQRLEAAGATALAMPCNTAHHYAAAITAAVSIPLLNMVDLSVAQASERLPSGATIGFLSSPAIKSTGVFDAALSHARLTATWPSDMDSLLAAIRLIKSNGPVSAAQNTLNAAATELVENGATMLFVACSEFSLIAETLRTSVPIIDTVDVLATAIHQHTLGTEAQP